MRIDDVGKDYDGDHHDHHLPNDELDGGTLSSLLSNLIGRYTVIGTTSRGTGPIGEIKIYIKIIDNHLHSSF